MGIFASKGDSVNRKVPVDQSNQLTQLDKAKLEVKRGKNRISKFSKKLELQIAKLDQDARRYLKEGNKKKALYTIKLKRLKIKSMENVEAQILSLENILLEIETTEMTQESLKAVQNGTNALNEMHRIMSVEDVEQILSENEDALDDANEIATLIAGTGDIFNSINEDDLEAELQALNGNVNKNNTNLLVSKMPNVPTHKVEQAKNVVHKENEKKRAIVTG